MGPGLLVLVPGRALLSLNMQNTHCPNLVVSVQILLQILKASGQMQRW